MITIHAWNKTDKRVQRLDASILDKSCDEAAPEGTCLWIDLAEPTAEEEQAVFHKFLRVHALSLEDITRLRREPEAPPHFPKVEEFPDYLFVIVNPITEDYLQHVKNNPAGMGRDKHFTQLSAVLTERVLITHHYEPLGCIEQMRKFIERHQAQAERGPDYLFHLVLDCTIDQYVPVLDYVDEGLDELEIEVLQKPSQEIFQRLIRLKREIILLRKTLIYEREVLVRLARGEFDLVEERETVYYRNVYDHLVRFTELIESSREMVSDLMQSYLAAVSFKLNEIMKVLTMISTIILPMTLIAGIYGMNFDELPEIHWTYGYPWALGLMVLTAVVALGFFKWKKWL